MQLDLQVNSRIGYECVKEQRRLCHIHWRNSSNFPAVYPANCMFSTRAFKVEFRQRAPPNTRFESCVSASDTEPCQEGVLYLTNCQHIQVRRQVSTNILNDLFLCSIPLKYTHNCIVCLLLLTGRQLVPWFGDGGGGAYSPHSVSASLLPLLHAYDKNRSVPIALYVQQYRKNMTYQEGMRTGGQNRSM